MTVSEKNRIPSTDEILAVLDALDKNLGTTVDAQSLEVTTTRTTLSYLKGIATNWTAARAANLDASISSRASQSSVDSLVSVIGATNNTGGTTAAGSTMAKLNALLTNLTSTRAGYLDAAITTRAPASTALSTAQWTAARAGYLDNLDAAITSRASQTAVDTKSSQTSVDGVNALIGATGNTGGTSSAGTVMAKLNALLGTTLSSSNWTDIKAGYLDIAISSRSSQTSLDAVNTLIGATNNTGGTTTAGSVMGKLNALLTNMTSTRAGYLDAAVSGRVSQTSFDTAVGATGNTGGSTTAGTVMAKLNAILSTTISSSDWTNIKAGYLDIAISSRASQTSFDTAVGATGNTGGSTTAGTVMAKLNAVLSTALSTATWTSTKAGYIDIAISGRVSQTSFDTALGATGNTGGTTTAGTVMAKLNAILTSWTSTRAGYLDAAVTSRASQTSLDTLVGATGNTGGTTTAGTVMGKLNALLTNMTSTRAGYLDAAISTRSTQTSLDALVSTVGATGNTGGSATAGSTMAKLNALITTIGATNNTGGTTTAGSTMAKLNALLTNLTSTRAGYLDAAISGRASQTSFDTAIGATGNTGGTTTAGTVMGKLNALLASGSSGMVAIKSITRFTSNGNWIRPSGVNIPYVIMIGGGGAGGGGGTGTSGSNNSNAGTGGASGLLMEGYVDVTDVAVGSSIAVTIGIGGVGTNFTGGAGGTSSFGNKMSAIGGSGGICTAGAGSNRGGSGGGSSWVPTGQNYAGTGGSGGAGTSPPHPAPLRPVGDQRYSLGGEGGNGSQSTPAGGGGGGGYGTEIKASDGQGTGFAKGGQGYGAGGGGAGRVNQSLGGNGANGIVIVIC